MAPHHHLGHPADGGALVVRAPWSSARAHHRCCSNLTTGEPVHHAGVLYWMDGLHHCVGHWDHRVRDSAGAAAERSKFYR